MQVTVMCPGCARLLTVKIVPPDRIGVICPTCGWKGKTEDGKTLIEDEEE